jgi:diguanylate cyclase (GGDEF)-like protein
VTIIDLDNFKNYNDTYGHQAGDQLLIRLADFFSQHFDEPDILARYGGDEFILMCPEIPKKETARIMGNLLHDLSVYDFARGKEGVKVSFSAGVSSFPEDGASVPELIKAADEALYDAKGAGRNTVRIHLHKIEEI